MFAILVPYYNEEKYIGRLINSLKQQVDKNFVVVFVDNLSTDRTREIIQSHSDYINKTWFVVDSHLQGQIYTFKPGANFVKLKFPEIKYIATVDADSYFADEFWTQSVNDTLSDNPDYGYIYGPRIYTELNDFPVLQKLEKVHNEALVDIISNTTWIGFGHNTVYDIEQFLKAAQSIVVNGGVLVACDLLTSLSVLLSGKYPSFFNSFVKTSGRRLIQSKATLEGFSFYDRNTHLTYLYSRTHLNPEFANEPAEDLNIELAEKFFKHRARKLAEQNFALLLIYERDNIFRTKLNEFFDIELDINGIERYKHREDLNDILWNYHKFVDFMLEISNEKFIQQLENSIYNKFILHWKKENA